MPIIYLQLEGTQQQDGFLTVTTLQQVADHFGHGHGMTAVRLQVATGEFAVTPMTTTLSLLHDCNLSGNGSSDKPFIMRIDRAGASGLAPGVASSSGQGGAGAGPGAAVDASRLVTIDEMSAVVDKLDKLGEEMQRLQVTNAPTACFSQSASHLGNAIKNQAVLVEMVQTTDAGRRAAKRWLKTSAATDFKAAILPGSRLREEDSGSSSRQVRQGQRNPAPQSLQGALSKLIAACPKGMSCTIWDKHNKRSVCRGFMPDVVISVGPDDPLPSSTVALVDIKRQDQAYDTGANFYQMYQCGWELFSQLPEGSRMFLLLGLTDLKTIHLMGMTYQAGVFTYQRSSPMTNALEVLCSIAVSPNEARNTDSIPPLFGAAPPPKLFYNRERLRLTSVLGCGATATVYACDVQVPGKEGKQQVAVKILNRAASDKADHEREMLVRLKGRDNIVQLLGTSDEPPASASCRALRPSRASSRGSVAAATKGTSDEGLVGTGLLLQPVGESLAQRKGSLDSLELFRSIPALLSAIHNVHGLGIVHRDLRTSNLLYVEKAEASKRLVIIDWGFAEEARPVGPAGSCAAPEFAGTKLCASDRVLKALQSADQSQPWLTFADDLETLVKSLFLLLHPALDAALHKLSSSSDLLKFWAEAFQLRPVWTSILEHARACEYEALGKRLSGMFE